MSSHFVPFLLRLNAFLFDYSCDEWCYQLGYPEEPPSEFCCCCAVRSSVHAANTRGLDRLDGDEYLDEPLHVVQARGAENPPQSLRVQVPGWFLCRVGRPAWVFDARTDSCTLLIEDPLDSGVSHDQAKGWNLHEYAKG